ncbi:hypothetical protein LCGC14_2497510, partial [marine sediment metagenome]
ITLWNGIIVDGHNRYEICTKENIKFKTINKKFKDKNEVIIWMIDNQLGRRNIPDYARVELNLRKEHIISKGKGFRSDLTLNKVKLDTNKQIAKESNVGHDTVSKVKFIRDNANEKIKKELRSGNRKLSINKVYMDLKRKSQREEAIIFLKEEKQDMTEEEYAEEYMGIASAEMKRFFNDDWITKVCTEEKNPMRRGRRYLGVDIGRMYDPSAFEDVCKVGETIYHLDSQTTQKTFTNETQDRIIQLNRAVNYERVGIDAGSGSLGVGVFDNLMIVPELTRKLVAMNNRAIALDKYGKKKQTLKGIDYYNNLKAMMYNRKILLLKDDDVIASLRSIRLTFPKTDDITSKVKIIGRDKHIVEGLMRAADLANQKGLNLRILSI